MKKYFLIENKVVFFQDDNFNVIFACKIYDNDVLFYFNLLIVIPEINFKKKSTFFGRVIFFSKLSVNFIFLIKMFTVNNFLYPLN